MANVTGGSLGPIYERLNSAPEYHPLEADTFADWSVEAGDIVTVTRDGKNYESPVHSSSVIWKKQQQVSVSSTGNEQRNSIARISQKKYNRGSSGIRNSNYLHWKVEDEYNQMATGLELTASSAHLYAYNKYTEMATGLKLTASTAILYATNKYTEMSTGLKLTASTAILYATNKYNEMNTGLKLTASSTILYAQNKYTEMSTGLRLTASSAVLYATNKYNEMSTGLKLTASSAVLYAKNKYNEMSTGLRLTASSAILYATNKYSEMSTGLKLTASSAILYATNKYSEMSTGLRLTASSAVLYATNKYNEMSSGLRLTASSAVLYASNKYNEMSSGLKLTASSAVLYARSKYSEMSTGLKLTASSAVLYATSKYNELKSGLSLSTNAAVLYARSADNAAEIVARINASTGDSEIKLNANRVYIGNKDAETVINGKLNVTELASEIGQIQDLEVNDLSCSSVDCGDIVYANEYCITQGEDYGYFTNCIVSAAVDGNTLTLTDAYGEEITFSKATTLSGAWSSGKFTVDASPQGSSFWTEIVQGTTSWSGTTATIPIEAYDSDNPQYQYATGRDVTVSVSLSDPEAKSVASDVTGSVQVRSKLSGGATGSYKSFAMSSSTYNPQGVSGTHDCVVVKDGNTVVGRYDIQSSLNGKYNLGWNDCRAEFLSSAETLYRVKSYTITPSDIGHVFNVTNGSVVAYTYDPGTK